MVLQPGLTLPAAAKESGGEPVDPWGDAPDAPAARKLSEQLGRDARWLFTLPAHLGPRGRLLGLGALGSTGLLYALREDLREEVMESSSQSRSDLLDGAREVMGTGATAPAVALGALLASLVTDSRRERETALMVLESAAFSAALAGAGSFVLAAERPRDGTDVDFFSTHGRGVSVDAALAASLVEPLRCQYLKLHPSDRQRQRVIKLGASVLLYAGAALTAFQRLDVDAHWAPDAFLGSVTGLAVGKSLCQSHGKEERGPDAVRSGRVGFGPLPGGALGVRIALARR
jgi:hypothetical protein